MKYLTADHEPQASGRQLDITTNAFSYNPRWINLNFTQLFRVVYVYVSIQVPMPLPLNIIAKKILLLRVVARVSK